MLILSVQLWQKAMRVGTDGWLIDVGVGKCLVLEDLLNPS